MSPSKKLSNSSSSEDDHDRYATILDEKKRKRMISNRESARRSRMKREQHIKDLNDQVTYFNAKSREMSQKIDEICKIHEAIESENRILRMQSEELKKKLELLNGMIVSINNMNYNNNNNNNSSYVCDDQYLFMEDFEDPLLKPWMQNPLQSQPIDGIYQF